MLATLYMHLYCIMNILILHYNVPVVLYIHSYKQGQGSP